MTLLVNGVLSRAAGIFMLRFGGMPKTMCLDWQIYMKQRIVVLMIMQDAKIFIHC